MSVKQVSRGGPGDRGWAKLVNYERFPRGWVKGRGFHLDEQTVANVEQLKARIARLGGLADTFLADFVQKDLKSAKFALKYIVTKEQPSKISNASQRDVAPLPITTNGSKCSSVRRTLFGALLGECDASL